MPAYVAPQRQNATLCVSGRSQATRVSSYIPGMKVMLDFCVVPLGVGVSVSAHVAECQRVLTELGLPHQMHPYGTVVEGEWDAVFHALRLCHERVHAMGAPRISTSIRLGTRTDREQTMQDKLDSVQRLLAQ